MKYKPNARTKSKYVVFSVLSLVLIGASSLVNSYLIDARYLSIFLGLMVFNLLLLFLSSILGFLFVSRFRYRIEDGLIRIERPLFENVVYKKGEVGSPEIKSSRFYGKYLKAPTSKSRYFRNYIILSPEKTEQVLQEIEEKL